MALRSGLCAAKHVFLSLGHRAILNESGKLCLRSLGSVVEQAGKLLTPSSGKQVTLLTPHATNTPHLSSILDSLFAEYDVSCLHVDASKGIAALRESLSTSFSKANGRLAVIQIPSSGHDHLHQSCEICAQLGGKCLIVLTPNDGLVSTSSASVLDVLSPNGLAQHKFSADQGNLEAAFKALQDPSAKDMVVVVANVRTENVVSRILCGEKLGTVLAATEPTADSKSEAASASSSCSGESPSAEVKKPQSSPQGGGAANEALLRVCEGAVAGKRDLQKLSAAQRSDLLHRIAKVLVDRSEEILTANRKDLALGDAAKIQPALRARLELSQSKLKTLAEGIEAIAKSPCPLGKPVLAREVTPGLVLTQETVPLGVLLVIFESRPDALPQVLSLALRSGNALILKGGKEAVHSNECLLRCINSVLKPELGENVFQLVHSRDEVLGLLAMDKYIDLVIPRGSNDLVRFIQQNTKIAVLGHADGVCHVYVDKDADPAKAIDIVVDAKCDYPAACNAVETVLLHQDLVKTGLAEKILSALKEKGVKTNGGPLAAAQFGLPPASSFHLEYGALECLVELVPDASAAIDWIHHNGSSHTEAVVTENQQVADTFLRTVDSACVYHNTSTRFSDGFRFGLGAEVGISTSRIHARGPVGVQGLLTTKWSLRSSGMHTVTQHKKGAWQYTHKELSV